MSAIATPPVERILAKLKRVKSHGNYWTSLCPSHDDREASLSIKVGTDGRALLNCHARCATLAIVTALGLSMSDLFAERPASSDTHANGADPAVRPRLVRSYSYTDADGNALFEACRLEYPAVPGETPRKTFRQRHKVGSEWVWNLDGVTPVLYRLPVVIEAAAMKRRIFVVEGEKDADALSELGYVATTNPMGAGKWRAQYTAILAGAEVVVFPDNDGPGEAHAATVAAELHAAGCSVKVVKLPGLPPKGDVSDYIASSDNSMDEFEDHITNTPPWQPIGAPRRVRWKLAELWKNDFIMRPPPAVVPRLAWAGRSTLLAAREKSGKSTLIGFITAAVTTGGQFLNEHTVKGDVLIVGLEEYLGDVARRLRHFGTDPDRTHLVDGFLGDPRNRTQEIREHVEDITPVLVVVDSLVAFANGRGIDENDAAMATIVQPLTDMSHETGTALVIVHHANKASGKARGSTSIMGATDVVCEFFSPDEDTDLTLRRMRSVGRVPLIRQYDVRFDGDTYHLADGLTAPPESRIIGTVRDRPGLSINDLVEAIGGRRDSIRAAVTQMIAQRTLENRGDSTTRARLYVPVASQSGFLR